MVAEGADVGGLGADDDVAAVAAFPHLHFAFGEDLFGLDVVQQGAVTLLVVLLDGGHTTELGGQLGEALGLCSLGKAFLHIGPLIVLACGGSGQVLGGGADAVQLLEPQLGVLLLVLGCLQEEGGNLLKAFLLGLRGEVGVLVAGLALASEGGVQVLLGLGASVGVGRFRLLNGHEFLLALLAARTFPVGRQLLKRCSGCYALCRVALCRVVLILANGAFVFPRPFRIFLQYLSGMYMKPLSKTAKQNIP